MNQQEISAIIKHARSAPLPNMDYAAGIDMLLRKLEQHFSPVKLEQQFTPVPPQKVDEAGNIK
jgi:hypothetical protein